MNIDDTKWRAFVDLARGDGNCIETVIKRVYQTVLPLEGHALDGGANVGLHTRGLSDHLVDGRVIAVEANELTFRQLERGTATRANVTRHLVAIQNDPACTEISFNCSPSHPGRSGISRIWDRIAPGKVEYAETVTVPATTIDQLIRDAGWSRLDFIKLDLEGGEFNALRGASDSLRTKRPLIVTEHSMHAPAANGFAVADYFGWLAELGYVAMDPAGQVADAGNPFPFWYLFLVPQESLGRQRTAIQSVVTEFM